MSRNPRTPDDDPGYDEVRRLLLERGYLQGPIERFVLGDLPEGRFSAVQTVLRTALRAAAIGGPILGAVLAGAAAAANRPLDSLVDPLVLWLYFTPLAALALFTLELGATLLAIRPLRKRGARPGDAVRAAVLVAAPILGYLLLLWNRRQPGAGLVEDLVFLTCAVAATLLVAWLAGIVTFAGLVRSTGQVPARSKKLAVLFVVVILPLAFAFLFLRGGDSGEAPAGIPAFDSATDRGRLLVVGVDGLDSELLDGLSALGELPNIDALMTRSSVFTLRRPAALEPPAVWTTLLTGLPTEVHGVTSVGLEKLPGVVTPLRRDAGPMPLAAALRFLLPARTVPSTGAQRRVPALWEIAGRSHATVSVGWWTSWPASDGATGAAGYLVTERLLPKLLSGAPADRDTLPAALHDRLAGEFPVTLAGLQAEFEAVFADVDATGRDRLREPFLIDAFHWRTAIRLFSDPATRSAFVYLPGLDILRTELAGDPPADKPSLADLALLGAYVAALDSFLGETVAGGDPGTRLLVTDPGRSAPGDARGFVAVSCPGCEAGCAGEGMGSLDVAPLILRLLGFPRSQELPGAPPEACLDGAGDYRGVISSYGRRAVSSGTEPSEFDQEMVDRLRSLGYLR